MFLSGCTKTFNGTTALHAARPPRTRHAPATHPPPSVANNAVIHFACSFILLNLLKAYEIIFLLTTLFISANRCSYGINSRCLLRYLFWYNLWAGLIVYWVAYSLIFLRDERHIFGNSNFNNTLLNPRKSNFRDHLSKEPWTYRT